MPLPPAAGFFAPAGWRLRTVAVAAVLAAAAHVLAAIGLSRGLPEAPYGDEMRYYATLVDETLRVVWLPWQEPSADAHAPAWLARLAVPAVLAWLALEVLARQLKNPLRLLRIRRRGGHVVLAGVSEWTRRLAGIWIRRGTPVLVAAETEDEWAIGLAEGAACVRATWGSPESFDATYARSARAVAYLAADDNRNLQGALVAAQFLQMSHVPDAPPVQVLVRVDDAFLRQQLDRDIDRFALLEVVQVRLLSAAQVMARRLLRAYPPDRFAAGADGGVRVWIFGVDGFAEELLLSILRLEFHPHGGKPSAAVIGPGALERRKHIVARLPGVESVGELRFEDAPLESAGEAAARLQQGGKLGSPTALFFASPSGGTNLAAAMSVCRALEQAGAAVPPVYLRTAGELSDEALGRLAGHPWLHAFGDASWFAEEMLVTERLDAVARRIHEGYVAEAMKRGEQMGARRSLRPWPLLPEDLKDDNRWQADHHFVKLRDAGFEVAEAPGAGDNPLTADEVERFARVEHERWLGQRVIAGWKYSEKRDDAKLLHPDMVPYEKLGEDRRELDRAVVRGLAGVLAEAGYALRRLAPVDLSAPPTPWAFTEGFEKAAHAELAELARRARGGLSLRFSPESAMACRIAELVLAGKLGCVEVELGETPKALLERQPSDDIRARVRALLVAAQKVVAPGAARAGATRMKLSIDGRDVTPAADLLALDANGRILSTPGGPR
jgi:hypothetical protein